MKTSIETIGVQKGGGWGGWGCGPGHPIRGGYKIVILKFIFKSN